MPLSSMNVAEEPTRDIFDRPVVGSSSQVQTVAVGRYEELPHADDAAEALPENLRSEWSKERLLHQP